jgi:hypothetical protein
MPTESFVCYGEGKTAQEAFDSERAAFREAWGGQEYTGTIAEKDSFVMIDLPAGEDAEAYAYSLIDANDPRIADKYGPAGCIEVGGDEWLFFGLSIG